MIKFKVEKYYTVPLWRGYNRNRLIRYDLYHNYGDTYLDPDGRVHENNMNCSRCQTKTPKNIMFAYKLWKWNNGV